MDQRAGKEGTINYRRGGIAMLPFVAVALLAAWLAGAPGAAFLSISGFGLVTAAVLICLGKRTAKK